MKLKKSEKDLEKFNKKISEEKKSEDWTISIEKKEKKICLAKNYGYQPKSKSDNINKKINYDKKMTDYFES